MLIFCDFIQVYVFTTNHHLKLCPARHSFIKSHLVRHKVVNMIKVVWWCKKKNTGSNFLDASTTWERLKNSFTEGLLMFMHKFM